MTVAITNDQGPLDLIETQSAGLGGSDFRQLFPGVCDDKEVVIREECGVIRALFFPL